MLHQARVRWGFIYIPFRLKNKPDPGNAAQDYIQQKGKGWLIIPLDSERADSY